MEMKVVAQKRPLYGRRRWVVLVLRGVFSRGTRHRCTVSKVRNRSLVMFSACRNRSCPPGVLLKVCYSFVSTFRTKRFSAR